MLGMPGDEGSFLTTMAGGAPLALELAGKVGVSDESRFMVCRADQDLRVRR